MKKQELFVRVEPEHDFRVKVFVPWQRKDWILKIKSLPNRAWNKEKLYWSVPKDGTTLLILKELFGHVLQINKGISESIYIEEKKDSTNSESGTSNNDLIPNTNLEFVNTKLNFKTIKSGGRICKVFTGNKILVEEANDQWLRVWVPFDKKGWIEIIKKIEGRKWEVDKKCWYIPYVVDSLDHLSQIKSTFISYSFKVKKGIPEYFKLPTKAKSKLLIRDKLSNIQKKAVTALENELLLERKSWRTIKAYRHHLINLLIAYPNERPSQISGKQVQAFILQQIKIKKITESTQNQLINGLKAFYERVCHQKDKVKYFIRPKKKPQKLPNVLSKKEVALLLNSLINIKHKAMLSLIYAAGLRKGELINLRKKDIIYSRKCIFVKNSKGKKDRYTMLSPKIENMLHQYIKIHKPKYWLFEGQTAGQYSETSLQCIFVKAKKRSGVNPYITIHGLRHSFATHLHESGVPLHAIKDLLGHNSIKTTEIYLHISNKFMQQIQSPLDFLNIN